MIFRIELLPRSYINFPAAEKTLNRLIIINSIKTSTPRINEVHIGQPTEAAAEPQCSHGESFGIYTRNSHVSPGLNPLPPAPFRDSWVGTAWSDLCRALIHAATIGQLPPVPLHPLEKQHPPVVTRWMGETRDRWQKRIHHVFLSAGDTLPHKSVALRKKTWLGLLTDATGYSCMRADYCSLLLYSPSKASSGGTAEPRLPVTPRPPTDCPTRQGNNFSARSPVVSPWEKKNKIKIGHFSSHAHWEVSPWQHSWFVQQRFCR